MRNQPARSKASKGLGVAFASALAVATSTAAFRDSFTRPDVAPPNDSLGTTEASPGLSVLDYRELETSGGFPVVFDVARVESGRLVVAGRVATTNPAFAVVNAAAENPSMEVQARFLFDDLNPALIANSLAVFLRGSGVASDGSIYVAGLVLLDLQADGFYLVRGVVTEGQDPVIFAAGFINAQSFQAADLDHDHRLESREPFLLGFQLDGAWFTFSFGGVNQVTNLYLAGVAVPPGVGDDVLLGRNRVSSSRPFWTSVAFDDLRETRVVDQDGDGSPADEDCNENDPAIHPGATERCNGVNDDCDDVVPANEADADSDGVRGCSGDCNDSDRLVLPGASERCNGGDDNCDGVVPVNEADADGDGSRVCGGDCNDGNASVRPGATELCNGRDDNCDGVVPANEVDADHDGTSTCGGDCDDTNPRIGPGAVELPGDETDENCDGVKACDPAAPWKNHGEYVSCVSHAVADLRSAGLITNDQAKAIKDAAARSDVGRRNDRDHASTR